MSGGTTTGNVPALPLDALRATAYDVEIDFTNTGRFVDEEITVRYDPGLSDNESLVGDAGTGEIAEDISVPDPDSPRTGGLASARVGWGASPDPLPQPHSDAASSAEFGAGLPTVPTELIGYDQPTCRSAENCVFSDIDLRKVNIRISGLIGQGRCGRVLLGMREDNGEMLAVKEVSLQEMGVEPQQLVQNLICEIQIMRPLNHPNIVRYFGTTMSNHTLNIYMEFVPGGSLASIIQKFGSLPETLGRKYSQQIVQGLVYLHGQEIVHRDIKGANILIDHKGLLKLADFGCSRQLMDLMRASQYTPLTGTPHWMAPEVIRQTGHGTPADIWSLGCTLIEMATGQPPFIHLGTNYAVMYAIGSTEDAVDLPPGLSPPALAFLRCCLDRDPAKRWPAVRLATHPWFSDAAPGGTAGEETATSSPPPGVQDGADHARATPLNGSLTDESPDLPPEALTATGPARKARPKPARLGEIAEDGFGELESPPEAEGPGGEAGEEEDDGAEADGEDTEQLSWAQARDRDIQRAENAFSAQEGKRPLQRKTQSATTRNRRLHSDTRKATSAPPKATKRLPPAELLGSPLAPEGGSPGDSVELFSPTGRGRAGAHAKQSALPRPAGRRRYGPLNPVQGTRVTALPSSSAGGRAHLDPRHGPAGPGPGFVPLSAAVPGAGAGAPPSLGAHHGG
eukprot:EG_transcript_5371